MKLQLFALALLLPVGLPANAQDACMAAARSSADMDACAVADLAAAERELNTVYHDVLLKHADDEDLVVKLRAAQRAWMTFRDAELAARYPDANPHAAYGSVYTLCAAGLRAQLARTRTAQLRKWLVGVAEGDVCAGSLPITGDPD